MRRGKIKTHFNSLYLACHRSRSSRIFEYSSSIFVARGITGLYGPIEGIGEGWSDIECF